MADPVVSGLLVLLSLQFLLWVAMSLDVRGAEDPTAAWAARVAILPVVGLVASVWYFASGRRTGR